MDEKLYQLQRDRPASYRICIQGALDMAWSAYLDNVTVSLPFSTDVPPVTVLTGRLVDQAALMGLLNNVHDLGYPLLSVVCLDHE